MGRKLLTILISILIAVTIVLFVRGQGKSSQIVLSTEELGFSLELVEEVKVPGFFPIWQGKVLISVENYSKENLDKIFTWYSKRRPKEDGKITLPLFVNKVDLEKKNPFTGVPADPNDKTKVSAPFNAVFFRLDEEDNEFYVYDLDPIRKGMQGRVVLKGRDPFAP